MGNKKRKKQMKPFCYYCGRSFDQEKTLVQHQKVRHFRCETCNRKMSTAHALMNHMFQVHKQTLTSVAHAKEGRDSVELNIFGMVGVPPEIIEERKRRFEAGQANEGGGGGAGGAKQASEEPPAKKQMVAPPSAPGYTPPSAPGYTPPSAPGYAPQAPRPPFGYNAGYGSYPPRPANPYAHPSTQPPQIRAGSSPVAVPVAPVAPPAASAPAPVAPPSKSDPKVIFIYKDSNNMSMEERRALHPKYVYGTQAEVKASVNNLSASIAARLSQLTGGAAR